MVRRTCATPGCRFHDRHDGPHSHERHCRRERRHKDVRGVSSRPIYKNAASVCTPKVRTVRCSAPVNDFQLGIDTVREAMDGQGGVRLEVPLDSFNGYWPGYKDMCMGRIIGPSYEGHFVAEAKLDDGEIVPLTSSQLMLHNTTVKWRRPHMDAERYLLDKCDVDVKHVHAMDRATEMFELLVASGIDLSKRAVLTLDGMGTNRVAGDRAFHSLHPSKRPEIWTLEMNANVALAQRVALGFGTSVRYTGADPSMKNKSSVLKNTGPPTLEDVVMFPNRILSMDAKHKVVCLNLDYCGGPPKNHRVDDCASFMTACLAHLFNLHMVSITIARRNHANLDETFDDIFPPPYGFRLTKVYTDNRRVVCKMYMRVVSIVRHLTIPGHWWDNPSPAWKRVTFDGVMVSKNRVYVPDDDKDYTIDDPYVAAYAADS